MYGCPIWRDGVQMGEGTRTAVGGSSGRRSNNSMQRKADVPLKRSLAEAFATKSKDLCLYLAF